jgi:hypothetical protein
MLFIVHLMLYVYKFSVKTLKYLKLQVDILFWSFFSQKNDMLTINLLINNYLLWENNYLKV